MTSLISDTRRVLGAMLLDLPRAVWLLQQRAGWVQFVNRLDKISVSQDPVGVRCLSDLTSSLHLADVLPRFGKWLQHAALREWSFALAQHVQFSESPEISVVIPHRGIERQSLLELTIRSWAALGGPVEVIVVEQDAKPHLGTLPGNTRYLHAPHPGMSDAWHKCFAFNVGVSAARGNIVVCHDSDLIVPMNYLREIQRHLVERKLDVVYPQRFLFYLDRTTTNKIAEQGTTHILKGTTPELIKQNWVGGTLAIRRDAYWRIGGFDEQFTGWTGEDREFYDRCQTLSGWFHGYIPFIHLWHAPQTDRVSPERRAANDAMTRALLNQPRAERIATLVKGRQEATP